jgi:hypothetical protein
VVAQEASTRKDGCRGGSGGQHSHGWVSWWLNLVLGADGYTESSTTHLAETSAAGPSTSLHQRGRNERALARIEGVRAEREARELAECTFTPNIRRPASAVVRSTRSPSKVLLARVDMPATATIALQPDHEWMAGGLGSADDQAARRSSSFEGGGA